MGRVQGNRRVRARGVPSGRGGEWQNLDELMRQEKLCGFDRCILGVCLKGTALGELGVVFGDRGILVKESGHLATVCVMGKCC